jgi:hypothetical protein
MSERWKRWERAIAQSLQGQRLPIIGRQSPDVVSASWACEVKVRREVPKWLLEAVAQAETGARLVGRRPLVVLIHNPGKGKRSKRLAILPLEVLEDWQRELGHDGKEVAS